MTEHRSPQVQYTRTEATLGDPRLPQHFWERVRAGLNGCWEWIGARSRGYGHIRWQGKQTPAHRVAYEVLIEPIPEHLEADHLCRNRACVNPSHIEPVTHRTNLIRGVGATARNARKTHCLNGHAFDLANTYLAPNGTRDCRSCRRDADQRWRRKHTAIEEAQS